MVNILRSRRYKVIGLDKHYTFSRVSFLQLNPVTRAVLILSGFALWTILSTFINTKSHNQDVHTGTVKNHFLQQRDRNCPFLARRNLLALEETSNAQIGEEISAVEDVSSAPVPEVFR